MSHSTASSGGVKRHTTCQLRADLGCPPLCRSGQFLLYLPAKLLDDERCAAWLADRGVDLTDFTLCCLTNPVSEINETTIKIF